MGVIIKLKTMFFGKNFFFAKKVAMFMYKSCLKF